MPDAAARAPMNRSATVDRHEKRNYISSAPAVAE